MIIDKNCKTCFGTGIKKIDNRSYPCPDCDYRDKLRIAKLMEEDREYLIPDDRMQEMQLLAYYFDRPEKDRPWHIQLLPGNKIRRVDWSWMEG